MSDALTGMYAREALARALRLNRFGEIRPLWEDANENIRRPWLEQADFVISALGRANLTILRPDQCDTELVAAISELMGFDSRDYIKGSDRAKDLVKIKRRVRGALNRLDVDGRP